MIYLPVILGVVLGLMAGGCSHDSGAEATPDPGNPVEDPITSIAVSPRNGATPAGHSLQFTATATHESGKQSDVTALVIWSVGSEFAGLAVISSEGTLQALRAGYLQVLAQYITASSTLQATTPFKVNKPVLDAVEISQAAPSIAKGTTISLVATGIYSDLTKVDLTELVTWSSSDPAAATVSDAAGTKGLAAGLATGTATVSAALSGDIGSILLTVTDAALASLEASPTDPTMSNLAPMALTATGIFADGTKQDLTSQVVWSSSKNAVATVSNVAGSNGVVTGAAAGTATISAAHSGLTASTEVTVSDLALGKMTPAAASLGIGGTLQFEALALFNDGRRQDITAQATWASDKPQVARVSNDPGTEGLVRGLVPGTTTVTATLGYRGASATVTVTEATLTSIDLAPAAPELALGTQLRFQAAGRFSDGSASDVTIPSIWTSSNSTTAVVSNLGSSSGLTSGLAAGSVTISAIVNATNYYGQGSFGVEGSITLPVTSATLTGIQVSPAVPSVRKGTPLRFTATGLFSDGSSQDLTSQVIWQSSDLSTAVVSNAAGSEGLAKAAAEGTAAISATFGGVAGATDLTVTGVTLAAIEITPAEPSVFRQKTLQFTATGVYSDGSTEDLTTEVLWSSSNISIATVSNFDGSEGLASAKDPGTATTATISATRDGTTGTTQLTVKPVVLESIEVTPVNPSIAAGTTLRFTATGNFSDGTTGNLTTTVTWVSSDTAVATVENFSGRDGLATGIAGGSATISASFGGSSPVGSTLLTVTP